MKYKWVVRASYGNDSCAMIQFAHEALLHGVVVLYSETGWAADWWSERVEKMEAWVRSLGFEAARTKSIGLEALVRAKKGWPRQGLQFCTQELKLLPGRTWLDEHDPDREAVVMIGKRREESRNRAQEPEWVEPNERDPRRVWQPLVAMREPERNALLTRAGIEPLPYRSQECYPCINSNRADLRLLAKDEARVSQIETIEASMGHTSKGSPRTMFRPYRYMGATGIREIVRWAASERGEFDPDDGTGGGCDSGLCGL